MELNDKPINVEEIKGRNKQTETYEKKDSIGNRYFASAMADFIFECDTPMTIGIQGDWGSGKTSLMKMIQKELASKRKTRIEEIELNTWNYSLFKQDEYLGISILNALLEQTKEKLSGEKGKSADLLEKASKAMRTCVSFLSKVEVGINLPVIGGGITTKISDAKEAYDNTDKTVEFENLAKVLDVFKKSFKEFIEETLKGETDLLVIYIDDLDRVKPAKAIEVLEALKLFMDIEKCVFVLAIDYSIVQLGIIEKYGEKIQLSSGKSFFDKIIQLPFNMPTASYDISEYIKSLLDASKILNRKVNNNIDFFVEITEVTIGRNPRSIKRAFNYATLLEKIRKEKNSKDSNSRKGGDNPNLLYAVVCFQIAWPELFDYFVLNPTPESIKKLEDWDFLTNLPQAQKLLNRVGDDKESLFDNLSAYFDILYEILDKGKDGSISNDDLKPLLNILESVQLISTKSIEKSTESIEKFSKDLNINSNDYKLKKFFTEEFEKSYWVRDENIQFKPAG
ncbi:MAG: hypothetical protein KDK36_15120, partial [Leptospiraceae bacterium]|nr:hypothetical protein [Leptospiraceae bacterium]